MSYTSDALKKEYRKETDLKRGKNLKYLRENIALLSLTDFSKETGITKNDVSMFESGDKTLSLSVILAYKKYFYDNHNINLSVDFIMGFTDIVENSNMDFQNKIGLSSNAIECLKYLQNDKYGKSTLDTLNFLMSDNERFMALIDNLDIILDVSKWETAVCVKHSNETAEPVLVNATDNDLVISFLKPDNNGSYLGALEIDSSVLQSHSLLKIKEIIDSYPERK